MIRKSTNAKDLEHCLSDINSQCIAWRGKGFSFPNQQKSTDKIDYPGDVSWNMYKSYLVIRNIVDRIVIAIERNRYIREIYNLTKLDCSKTTIKDTTTKHKKYLLTIHVTNDYSDRKYTEYLKRHLIHEGVVNQIEKQNLMDYEKVHEYQIALKKNFDESINYVVKSVEKEFGQCFLVFNDLINICENSTMKVVKSVSYDSIGIQTIEQLEQICAIATEVAICLANKKRLPSNTFNEQTKILLSIDNDNSFRVSIKTQNKFLTSK